MISEITEVIKLSSSSSQEILATVEEQTAMARDTFKKSKQLDEVSQQLKDYTVKFKV